MRGGVLVAALSVASCATGKESEGPVLRDYHPEVLITYAVEGDARAGEIDYLVREGTSLAIFEQTASGAGRVLRTHWRDRFGDHFASGGWRFDPAWEVLVPFDQSRPAYRFTYDVGTYRIQNRDGVAHPVPMILTEASAELRPAGRAFREPPPEVRSTQKGH